jgi:cell division transport system permease protein
MTDRGPPRPRPSPELDAIPGVSLKRNMPLVPASSIAGRALITVIAIMTFLASLAAGAGILVGEASRDWTQNVAREMTIQVKPVAGRDIEADVRRAADLARATPGVAQVRIFDKAQSEHLLEPWLGTGLDLGALPIPRLIVLELGQGRFDSTNLRKTLGERAPNALLDDHRLWLERLAAMARALVGLVTLIFALVLMAMGLAVTFATRGAMAGNREILDVLHFVGAEDRFIAAQFQRHFLWLGLRGGCIGGGCAMAAFALSGVVSGWFANFAESDQIQAMFGGFGLGVLGYLAIGVIALGVAFLTAAISRTIVFRHLRSLG